MMKQRTNWQRGSLWLIAVLFLVMSPYPAVGVEKIVLVGSDDTKASVTGEWLNLIYTEVFRRLGYELEYNGYPNERAAVISEAGLVDGEIQRAASYEKSVKNLRKVEEPSFTVVVAAYAVTPGIVLDGWESLKNKDYIVEYRRGSKLSEKTLPKVVNVERLQSVTTVVQGLKKLIMGRTDIFIEQELVVAEASKKLVESQFDISSVYQAGIMWTGESHLYLHKRHTDLLPKIAKVLGDMKREGLIKRYKEAAQDLK